jgi:hypothetical protein
MDRTVPVLVVLVLVYRCRSSTWRFVPSLPRSLALTILPKPTSHQAQAQAQAQAHYRMGQVVVGREKG